MSRHERKKSKKKSKELTPGGLESFRNLRRLRSAASVTERIFWNDQKSLLNFRVEI